MRKIIAITQVTVDGVMQAPGGSEEDRRSGFNYGGWAMPFVDGSLNIVETVRDYGGAHSHESWNARPRG
jgi:hypothetical protein